MSSTSAPRRQAELSFMSSVLAFDPAVGCLKMIQGSRVVLVDAAGERVYSTVYEPHPDPSQIGRAVAVRLYVDGQCTWVRGDYRLEVAEQWTERPPEWRGGRRER